MVVHARSQADRAAVLDDDHILLLPWRRIRHDGSSRADDAARRSLSGADLQQVVFDTRDRHDFSISNPFNSVRVRKFPVTYHELAVLLIVSTADSLVLFTVIHLGP